MDAMAGRPWVQGARAAADLGRADRHRAGRGVMTGQLAGLLSFRRIAGIPFDACMAMLENWQLSGHDGELRLGNSVLQGPIKCANYAGTCRIDVRLARGPLRLPVRMRLDIEPWSATSTALELIPCRRVRPSAAYFAAGHHLLDSLIRTLPARVPAQQRPDQTICAQPPARAARLSARA
jgi:hypothetical protein